MTVLDRVVYAWAAQFWPDLAWTWDAHRDYYRSQYHKSHQEAVA